MENAEEVGGKVGENLRASLNQLPLSKKLTTIKCDVELEDGLFELKAKDPDRAKLVYIFTKLGFKSWLDEQPDSYSQIEARPPKPVVQTKYETVLDNKTLAKWASKLMKSEVFSFDTETTSLNYMEDELVGISFGVEPGIAAYIPIGHVEGDGQKDQLPLDTVFREIKPLLESKDHVKVGQNLKYDINVMSNYGINVSPPYIDTMLQSYVLNSIATRHNMDDMARHYLGRETIHFEDVAVKGAKQILFSEVSIDAASEYASEDADVTLQLHQELSGFIANEPTPVSYTHLTLPTNREV